MEIIYPKDAHSFLKISQKALEENEVNGNLILGISNALTKNENAYGTDAPFYSIAYNNGVSIIGLMTPPKNLLLYEHNNTDNNVMELFINELYSKNKYIPGVTGEINVAKSFMEKWTKISGCNCKINMNLRIFKLTMVEKYNRPSGIFRSAEKRDIEKIIEFITEFYVSINEIVDIGFVKEIAENGIKNNDIFVWENSEIVSMAKKQRPTKHGMAVSHVYTPIEYRRKGYATAVVAELSQNILDSGKTFCTLYTDLSNPTSNSIYRKIGYYPISDSISYVFEKYDNLVD
jgi:predicted GNAT family acetyltransferase